MKLSNKISLEETMNGIGRSLEGNKRKLGENRRNFLKGTENYLMEETEEETGNGMEETGKEWMEETNMNIVFKVRPQNVLGTRLHNVIRLWKIIYGRKWGRNWEYNR